MNLKFLSRLLIGGMLAIVAATLLLILARIALALISIALVLALAITLAFVFFRWASALSHHPSGAAMDGPSSAPQKNADSSFQTGGPPDDGLSSPDASHNAKPVSQQLAKSVGPSEPAPAPRRILAQKTDHDR